MYMTLLQSHAALIGALDTILELPPWIPSQSELAAAHQALDAAKQLQEEKNRTDGHDEFSASLTKSFDDFNAGHPVIDDADRADEAAWREVENRNAEADYALSLQLAQQCREQGEEDVLDRIERLQDQH